MKCTAVVPRPAVTTNGTNRTAGRSELVMQNGAEVHNARQVLMTGLCAWMFRLATGQR